LSSIWCKNIFTISLTHKKYSDIHLIHFCFPSIPTSLPQNLPRCGWAYMIWSCPWFYVFVKSKRFCCTESILSYNKFRLHSITIVKKLSTNVHHSMMCREKVTTTGSFIQSEGHIWKAGPVTIFCVKWNAVGVSKRLVESFRLWTASINPWTIRIAIYPSNGI
jgi:hypothetical protein